MHCTPMKRLRQANSLQANEKDTDWGGEVTICKFVLKCNKFSRRKSSAFSRQGFLGRPLRLVGWISKSIEAISRSSDEKVRVIVERWWMVDASPMSVYLLYRMRSEREEESIHEGLVTKIKAILGPMKWSAHVGQLPIEKEMSFWKMTILNDDEDSSI